MLSFSRRNPSLRIVVAICFCVLLAGQGGTTGAAWDPCAAPLARYVRASPTRLVSPSSVQHVEAGDGSVDDADAILVADGRGATLRHAGGAAAVLVVDFGQVVSGRLSVVSLASTGPELRIAVSESLRFLGPQSDTDWGEQGTAIWRLPTGAGTFESGQRTFRYVRLSLEGPGAATIDALSLYQTAFHGTPDTYAGCFLSSDDLVNRMWYAGAYTVELNTVPTPDGSWTLVDGAKRDRLPWAADLAMQAWVEYLTHRHPEPVRAVLADLAAHQRDDGAIPPSPYGDYSLIFYDYCAWWVIALAEYADHTGDLAFVASLYPNLVRQMAWFDTRTRVDGLLVKDTGLEWAYTLDRAGAVTYLNVVWYRALADAARLATLLGHAGDAERWAAQADALRSAINAFLFDESRGVYVDSNIDRLRVPLDANVLAIAFGVAPAERIPGILAYLREHHWTPYGSLTVDPGYGADSWHNRRIWPFMVAFEARARFEAGDDAAAWDLLRRTWGHMLTTDPASTTWEWMTDGGEIETGFASLAHGWSAGATALLSAYAIGVRPESPGYATFVVDPHPGDLAWARGRVPTPHGPVDVSWRRFSGGFSLRVTVPQGTLARVAVPVDDATALVLLHGEPVWQSGATDRQVARREGNAVWLDLGPGEFDLVATDNALFVPETIQYLTEPFLTCWERNGGVPVFGYPLSAAFEEPDGDTGEAFLVQYVERQRMEYHPEHAGTPYAILLGLLGVEDATQRGLIAGAPFEPHPAPPPGSDCTWFEATGHAVCGRFLRYWQSRGLDLGDDGVSTRESLALFGYPISEPFIDPASGLTVQYFERARFEYHPEHAGTPWEVLLGRLGADLYPSAACCMPAGSR